MLKVQDRRHIATIQGEDEVRRRIVEHPKGSKVGPFGERLPCESGYGHWDPTQQICVRKCSVNAECACVRLQIVPKVVLPPERRQAMNPCPWPKGHIGAKAFDAIELLIKGKRAAFDFSAEDIGGGLSSDELDHIDSILESMTHPDFLYPPDWDVQKLQVYWGVFRELGGGLWEVDPKAFRAAVRDAREIDRGRR